MDKKELNNYYKEIYKNLPCSYGIKKVFIKSFKNRFNEFIEDNPNSTIDDLKKNFGEPKEIINSFEGQNAFVNTKLSHNLKRKLSHPFTC